MVATVVFSILLHLVIYPGPLPTRAAPTLTELPEADSVLLRVDAHIDSAIEEVNAAADLVADLQDAAVERIAEDANVRVAVRAAGPLAAQLGETTKTQLDKLQPSVDKLTALANLASARLSDTAQRVIDGAAVQPQMAAIYAAAVPLGEQVATNLRPHADMVAQAVNPAVHHVMQSVEYAESKYDKLNPNGKAAVKAVAIGVAGMEAERLGLAGIELAGFGANGVRAGSLAAKMQKPITRRGSVFATLQSVGRKGLPASHYAKMGAAEAAGAFVGDRLASKDTPKFDEVVVE